jgi:T5SS/PEP-CTERM-associated repeat protein
MKTALTALVVLAVAAMSIDPGAARADVEVVEVHVNRPEAHAGATILIRPVLVLGDGVTRSAPHVEGTDVGAYSDTVTARLDSLDIHAEATGSQTTSIAASGDTLSISSTATISGSKTLSGVVKTDQGSSASDSEACSVSFKVSKPSVYVLVATMSYSGAGGGAVFLPDGQQVQLPTGFQHDQLSVVRTGQLAPPLSNGQPVTFEIRLFGGNGIGTIAPPVTQFGAAWHFAFDVRPEGSPGDDIHWTKTSGGSFGTDANWNPQQVPVKDVDHTDNAIFDVAGAYTVEFAGAQRHGDRLEVLAGDVTFVGADLLVDNLDLVRPSFTVDAAKLTIASGNVISNSATIGSLHAADAQVRVDGDAVWYCQGRLRIGGSDGTGGAGVLSVTNGADGSSHDTRIGAGAQTGRMTVEGSLSHWDTDNVHVGFSSTGVLEVLDGGFVSSAVADVGGGFVQGGDLGIVNVLGVDSDGHSSKWQMASLGLGTRSTVDVGDGATIESNGGADLLGGALFVNGVDAAHARPSLVSCGGLTVGAGGEIDVSAGGDIEVSAADLIVGPSVPTPALGSVTVKGVDAATSTASLLHVSEGVAIGFGMGGAGNLSILDGAKVQSGHVSVGTGSGEVGVVLVDGAQSSWSATGGFDVGGAIADAPGSSGVVVLNGGVLSVTGDLHVDETGSVQGTGNVVMFDGGQVIVDGLLSPAILQGVPLEPLSSKTKGPAPRPPSTLTVDGDLVVDPTGVVRVDAGGPESDHVVVTGDATLDGTLVVQFMNGYAPRAGEHFDVVHIDGQTTGDFATVDVRGLAPGAQFTTAVDGGTRTMTATNDTVALPTVSVKPATKRVKEKSKKPIVLKFSRKGDTSQALTVSYAVGGTAGNGLDCVSLPGTITIPAGKRSAKVKVVLVDDFRHEGDETLTVTVLPGADYTHSLASTARVTISDND